MYKRQPIAHAYCRRLLLASVTSMSITYAYCLYVLSTRQRLPCLRQKKRSKETADARVDALPHCFFDDDQQDEQRLCMCRPHVFGPTAFPPRIPRHLCPLEVLCAHDVGDKTTWNSTGNSFFVVAVLMDAHVTGGKILGIRGVS